MAGSGWWSTVGAWSCSALPAYRRRMTVALVNGNPETAAVWGPLLEHLHRDDVVLLEPPGFGGALPPGWGATVGEYQRWLGDELGALTGPVDLVGHDWGGLLTVLVAMDPPEQLRSWVSDELGAFDPCYAWHDLAQQWQEEGTGEAVVRQLLEGGPDARIGPMVAAGMPEPVARELAAAFGEDTAGVVLPLYRSARQPFLRRAGEHLERAAARPGLAVIASEDPTAGTLAARRTCAARAGAAVVELPGLSHWWMTQDPAAAARALGAFWDGLPPEAPS